MDRKGDFRLICATCRDLPLLVEQGKFRSDLFYRIQGASLSIPPLRERSDRRALAEALVDHQAGPNAPALSDDAVAWIEDHDWPGNVRELKSAIEHALALSSGEQTLHRDHFPKPLVSQRPRASEPPRTREQILKLAIDTALRACDGNVSEAARQLGVGRGTIYRALRGDRNDG